MGNRKRKLAAAFLALFILSIFSFAAIPAKAESTEGIGGGYAVTGQLEDVGYSSVIYDAEEGMPTSDANYVLGASDGYIWIGGYSGILRYDGNTFTRLPNSGGFTNGRGLFEDNKGRIWVGTNDNGVVVIDGKDTTHLTYKEGLPSSSIRTFAQDNEGNVFIGTTEGVCYADPEMNIHVVDDKRIKSEMILKLDSDPTGKIYGHTKSGIIFLIDNKTVKALYSGKELGTEIITTLKTDPENPGKVYLGCDGGAVYYGEFGASAALMKRISVAPLGAVQWISYDCNRFWIASTSKVGFLDNDGRFCVLDDIPLDSGIEMMTSDYQGNMWFASSTKGVMKIVTNKFVNVNKKANLPEEVTNAACLYNGALYIGANKGLRIIDSNYHSINNELTDYIGDSRIRCIERGTDGDLWIATFTNQLGAVHLLKDGQIEKYTIENGMPSNEVRCISVQNDGRVLLGTNNGLAIIRDNQVIRTIGAAEGITNTVFLTVEEGEDGKIYIGTDGDGIYVSEGSGLTRRAMDDGLTSDVVLKIKWDETRKLYWIVTSNSIEYLKDGVIKEVSTFPYNNNYDIYFADPEYAWVISSCGIYRVKTDEMIRDEVQDYRLYTLHNGLTSTPTANGYSELDDEGNLFIPGREGVSKVNITGFTEESMEVKAYISSVYCGEEEILPDGYRKYTIPASGRRVVITASVLDYTMLNPQVRLYMEGKEDEGISVARSDLKPLEYTGLAYGDYTLHIRVMDGAGKTVLLDEKYKIVKKALFLEHPIIRLVIFFIVAFAIGFIVWMVMKGTIIRRQYEEIKQSRDEAERANAAKTRFLANISHEIRTPINTIMGMNEMSMREDPAGVPKPYFMSMMNYAFDIRNASESLLSLVNDLLDISKMESGKMHLVPEEYDTHEMLRSIVSMIRMRSTQKELTFDVVVDEILPGRLYGDQGKIKQIVLNLLTNAVKYTDVGGLALTVSMEERVDDTCSLAFSVKDTGIGVKEEDMDRLFSAYERLDEQKNSGIQGTGLGLEISRKFAELMGGTLTCESEYGKGSEFILKIDQKIIDQNPLGVFKEQDDTTSGPYVPLFVAPDADILVVDDNPMNLNVIRGLLKGTKVFVTTASSGEDCLEKIKDTRFDVVLLDHMMPGMDGVETVANIRKDYPDLPVYALTANTAVGEDFYKSKGFDGYLSKPVDSRLLEQTIMKHLSEEMMEKPTAENAVEELTEIPENLMWIYETEGISVPDGIKNSGGISNYIFSLEMFLDTIDVNAGVISDAYESGNIRLYTIKVHSLKSSAKFVGAMELSALAESLENAGNKEDMDYINANTARLLADYEGFREKLERLHDEMESPDKEMIPDNELKEAYTALSDMIPQMDYDAVEMILEQMREYSLPKEDEQKMKQLEKMLKVFDWDEMEKLICGG